MGNFTFLRPAFKDLAEASRKAEERRRRTGRLLGWAIR